MIAHAFPVVLQACGVLFISIGCAFLFRSGLVHTGVIAQMIAVEIALSYASQIHLVVGLIAAWTVSICMIAVAATAFRINRRTYIVALFALSLAATPMEALLLSTNGASATGATSPSVPLGGSPKVLMAIASAAAVLFLLLLIQFQKSWRGVLFEHLGSVSARTFPDMQLSGVFSVTRLLKSAILPLAWAAAAFVAASLVLTQLSDHAAGRYEKFAFLPLLFAVAAHHRPVYLVALVAFYGLAAAGANLWLSQMNISFSVYVLNVLYGAVILLLVFRYRREEERYPA